MRPLRRHNTNCLHPRSVLHPIHIRRNQQPFGLFNVWRRRWRRRRRRLEWGGQRRCKRTASVQRPLRATVRVCVPQRLGPGVRAAIPCGRHKSESLSAVAPEPFKYCADINCGNTTSYNRMVMAVCACVCVSVMGIFTHTHPLFNVLYVRGGCCFYCTMLVGCLCTTESILRWQPKDARPAVPPDL